MEFHQIDPRSDRMVLRATKGVDVSRRKVQEMRMSPGR
jgi:hypothetical protein